MVYVHLMHKKSRAPAKCHELSISKLVNNRRAPPCSICFHKLSIFTNWISKLKQFLIDQIPNKSKVKHNKSLLKSFNHSAFEQCNFMGHKNIHHHHLAEMLDKWHYNRGFKPRDSGLSLGMAISLWKFAIGETWTPATHETHSRVRRGTCTSKGVHISLKTNQKFHLRSYDVARTFWWQWVLSS